MAILLSCQPRTEQTQAVIGHRHAAASPTLRRHEHCCQPYTEQAQAMTRQELAAASPTHGR
eukprot:1161802-Pelagomonas_calceolata.AAC.6